MISSSKDREEDKNERSPKSPSRFRHINYEFEALLKNKKSLYVKYWLQIRGKDLYCYTSP
jgi:polyphosphate kinase 2 (PPK2 family)